MNDPLNNTTDASAPPIIFEKVSLRYGDTVLFDNFDLKIKGGQTTCILGPSGCGKSTLLHMISARPEVEFTGKITISSEPNQSTLCSWMSQKDLLLPWLSVCDNVLLGAKLRNETTPSLKEKAESLLVQAGLGDYLKSLPAVLSGGMRQRVALLRTLMEGRPVLLMDEPFSALDALTRLKLQDISATLTAGKTVVLVTHDPIEALRLGDEIIVLGDNSVHVAARLAPGGSVPRDAKSKIISHLYPTLLDKLLSPSFSNNTPQRLTKSGFIT